MLVACLTTQIPGVCRGGDKQRVSPPKRQLTVRLPSLNNPAMSSRPLNLAKICRALVVMRLRAWSVHAGSGPGE